jgi:FkbM family methyltransferase
MSIFARSFLLRGIKSILKATVYRPGSVALIMWGQLKGYKYVIDENSGWAPIYGGWEPCAEKAYPLIIKEGDVVYDVGANIGITSLLFSKLVGVNGKVFAFEPVPANTKDLKSNVTLNNANNIIVVEKAISDGCRSEMFNLGVDNKSGSLLCFGKESGESIPVEVTTLDELIKEGFSLPDFIKIDVEGSAGKVLEGFSQSIAECYPAFLIELHIPQEDGAVGKFLKEHGYRIYRLKRENSDKIVYQKELLVEIKNMESVWPDLSGVCGTIIAIHKDRQADYNLH